MEGPGLILPGQIAAIPWLSAGYYDAGYGATGTVALVANTLYAVPIIPIGFTGTPREPVSLDRVGIEITTAAAAGKLLRCGLYTFGSDGKPDQLVVDSGALAADAIAYVEATIAATAASGVPLYRVVVSDSTPTVRTEGSTGFRFGVTAGNVVTGSPALSVAFVFAALPQTFPAGAARANVPARVMVRRA